MVVVVGLCSIFQVVVLGRYPAPGNRHRDTGSLTIVGNGGSVWSTTVSGSNGVYLYFFTALLNPSYTTDRAFGLQVRCLQE